MSDPRTSGEADQGSPASSSPGTFRWHRWGVQLGHWHVTWWDLWRHRPTFEVVRDKESP